MQVILGCVQNNALCLHPYTNHGGCTVQFACAMHTSTMAVLRPSQVAVRCVRVEGNDLRCSLTPSSLTGLRTPKPRPPRTSTARRSSSNTQNVRYAYTPPVDGASLSQRRIRPWSRSMSLAIACSIAHLSRKWRRTPRRVEVLLASRMTQNCLTLPLHSAKA
jgi:hypothetical protein